MKNFPDGESVRENHNLFVAFSNEKRAQETLRNKFVVANHLLGNGENLDGRRGLVVWGFFFFFQRSLISVPLKMSNGLKNKLQQCLF